jgi:hypothetical protein
VGTFILIAFAVTAFRVWRFGVGWFVAFIIMTVAILLVAALYQALYILGTHITVTADAILVTHWFWSTTRVNPRRIVRVVRCSVNNSVGRKTVIPRPAVFVIAASGRCVLSLYAERWDTADLDRIWRHLGITPEGSWDRTILDDDLYTEFPGAF